MTFRTFFRASAERDLEVIEDWFELQRTGLGCEFRDAVAEAVGRIASNPFQYADLYRGNRRALLRRFKYALWYRVTGEVVLVLACVHGRRNPEFVSRRIRGDV